MIIDFIYENDHISCIVELDSKFIVISSNLLLNNLLKIEVEILDENENFNKTETEFLNHKSFNLNKLNCQ